MNKQASIPSGISALRLVALPVFLYFFSTGATMLCFPVFASAQATDLINGYLAIRFGVTSKSGAYFNAVADFCPNCRYIYSLRT